MESLLSWGRPGVCACVRAAPSQPRAAQCTPANFAAASTPARGSAAPQTTSARPQPLLLPDRWRSPESQVCISTHSPATANLSRGDQSGPAPDLPGASSAPPALVYTASGGPWVGCVYTASAVSGSTPPSTWAIPSRFTRCLILVPTLPACSRSCPGCGVWFTHCEVLSLAKGNLVILLKPSGFLPLTPSGFFFFFFLFLAFRTILSPPRDSKQTQLAAGAWPWAGRGRGLGGRGGVSWPGPPSAWKPWPATKAPVPAHDWSASLRC